MQNIIRVLNSLDRPFHKEGSKIVVFVSGGTHQLDITEDDGQITIVERIVGDGPIHGSMTLNGCMANPAYLRGILEGIA